MTASALPGLRPAATAAQGAVPLQAQHHLAPRHQDRRAHLVQPRQPGGPVRLPGVHPRRPPPIRRGQHRKARHDRHHDRAPLRASMSGGSATPRCGSCTRTTPQPSALRLTAPRTASHSATGVTTQPTPRPRARPASPSHTASVSGFSATSATVSPRLSSGSWPRRRNLVHREVRALCGQCHGDA